MPFRQSLGALEPGFGADGVGSADAVLEERAIRAQAGCEPVEHLRVRSCLATLDLADVFLRDAAAGELGLRQTRRVAEHTHAFAEADGGSARSSSAALGGCLRLPQSRRFRHQPSVWTRRATVGRGRPLSARNPCRLLPRKRRSGRLRPLPVHTVP
jgi:hypothetical protein